MHKFNFCTDFFQRYKFYGTDGRPGQMSVTGQLPLAMPSDISIIFFSYTCAAAVAECDSGPSVSIFASKLSPEPSS